MAVSNLSYKKYFTLLLTVSMMIISYNSNANDCINYIPEKAITLNDLTLCYSRYTGFSEIYSCQDYHSSDKRYRVLYKGGLLPKAILTINNKEQEKLIWSTSFGDRKLSCPLIPPLGIHIHAKHHGTGICKNNNNQLVPCSIYEHKTARNKKAHRYLVFYPSEESLDQSINFETYITDATEDAMTAEFAFQIGLQLLNSDCCKQQAMSYLEYAYRLYPKANKYSKAYNNAKFNLSLKNF